MKDLPTDYFIALRDMLTDSSISPDLKLMKVCNSIGDIVLSAGPTDNDLLVDKLISDLIPCAINCVYNRRNYMGALSDLRTLYDSIRRK